MQVNYLHSDSKLTLPGEPPVSIYQVAFFFNCPDHGMVMISLHNSEGKYVGNLSMSVDDMDTIASDWLEARKKGDSHA